MAKPRITIVGLGFIGGSMGLALREAGGEFEVIGHDREPLVARKARKLGVVDRTDWNLISACEGADLIIIATPLMGVEQTLRAIAPYLKAGCLITDTASIKAPVLKWASELLPDEVDFVGGDPIVSGARISAEAEGEPASKKESTESSSTGLEAARADLFAESLYCLIPAPQARPEAMQLAMDLVHLLGAQPYFLDATEHDGLVAGVDQLPFVLSTVLLRALTESVSWREMRKLAGNVFQDITRLTSTDPAVYRDACLSNGENIVRWIDEYAAHLVQLKELVAAGDEEKLTEVFENALVARERWLRDREEGRWEAEGAPAIPARTSFLRRFIGIG